MTKGTWIATIVIGAAWCVLAAEWSEPSNRPATELPAKPAAQLPPQPAIQPSTQPAGQPAPEQGKRDRGKEDSNSAPPCTFFDSDANASHFVYVVDRSGSMAPTFQKVQIAILKSIGRLQPGQDFTIIFFADKQFIEGPQKRLVLADTANKRAADNFLRHIIATGSTNVLPALKRAFQVLKQADTSKLGRIIYLLSDGDFAGMSGGSQYTTADGKTLRGNEAVIQWLRDNNPKEEKTGLVHVNTLLYLNKDDDAKKVMETIAKENGGRFKLITPDE